MNFISEINGLGIESDGSFIYFINNFGNYLYNIRMKLVKNYLSPKLLL